VKKLKLEEMENLPEPDVIAAEIVENLEFTLDQFRSIHEELESGRSWGQMEIGPPIGPNLFYVIFRTSVSTGSI